MFFGKTQFFFRFFQSRSARLNLNIKAFLAARAANGVSSLLLWQAQLTVAGRALAVHVCFAVAMLVFLQLEPTANPSKKAAKRTIFLLPFQNVS